MKIKLLVALLALVPALVPASDFPRTTNSPYSQYGYGKLTDPSYGAQKAMGGIGYGLRKGDRINPVNPASFSCVDSMTFMFDVAISGQISLYDDGINKVKGSGANLEYVAIQFPLLKNMGMGMGFKPISQVGYRFGEEDQETYSVISYTGSGGLNQVYGALSYEFNRIATGVNVGYLFGGKYHNGELTIADGNANLMFTPDTLIASGLVLDFGIQYTHPIDKDRHIVIGAVYSPKLPLNANYSEAKITDSSTTGQEVYEYVPFGDLGYDLPETYGIGLAYAKGNKFLAEADYTFQKWSNVRFHGKKNIFNDRTRINVGCEFTPDARGRDFFRRVRYRLGSNYSNSYISPITIVDGKAYQFDEYGVSLGFGLPLVGGRSRLNMAFEYSKTNPSRQIQGLIQETYFKFTLSYTFNEMWFFKRKVQ